ncbi:MAG: bifunctional ornithine acetyltransferase/N-acetylglutamate synthase, partial [Pseudomonadota bacterium]
FEVSSDVLIPRPETEQLVVLGLDWLKQRQDVVAGPSSRPPIIADVGVGSGEAQVWTCDLTHGYIDINADYRS